MAVRARRASTTVLGAALACCLVLTLPSVARADDTAPPTSPPADATTPAAPPTTVDTPAPPTTSTTTEPPTAAPPADTPTTAAPPPATTATGPAAPPSTARSTAPARPAATPTTATPSTPPLNPLGPPPVADAVGPDAGVIDELYNRYQDLLRAQAALRTAMALEKAGAARLSTTGLAVADATIAAADAHQAAVQARDVLTTFTRQAYMEGSELGVVAGLAAMSADDIISALSSASYLDSVARYRIDAALRAVAEEKRTEAARQAAVVARQQAEAAAATAHARTVAAQAAVATAQAAYNAAMAAGIPPTITVGLDGCPTTSLPNVLRDGADAIGLTRLCQQSVAQAASPWAAAAIKWAFAHLGAPYACGGVGRDLPFRFDCSSLVSRAYHEGAGLPTAGTGWSPSTRDMLPWDGASLAPSYYPVAPAYVRPGDLVLYDTGGATYRHVVMVLADGYMLHTNRCGDVAHVARFWGMFDGRFLGARRVLPAR